MPQFILLMHSDVQDRSIADDGQRWGQYLRKLRSAGGFGGGSSIGAGVRMKRGQPPRPSENAVEGFIRIDADSLEDVQGLVDGNPNYEGGGTIEIRELSIDE